jgi:hypothetical protein
MDQQNVGSRPVEPKAPHAFVERLSQPFNGLGGAFGAGPTGDGAGIAFRKTQAPDNCRGRRQETVGSDTRRHRAGGRQRAGASLTAG